MSYSNYLQALEARLKWLWWAQNKAAAFYGQTDTAEALPMYEHALKCGETFFMTKHFCELVDVGRREIPDTLKFDPNWMVTKNGFMWLEVPFQAPELKDEVRAPDRLRISAVAWFEIPVGIESRTINEYQPRISVENTYEFLMFHDLRLVNNEAWGFGCWSYFSLQPGDEVLDRIRLFEQVAMLEASDHSDAGAYVDNRERDKLHEVRWVYTALHMMSQKLASTKQYEANRNVRRRMEKEKNPITTFYRVVTLRRLAEEQEKHSEKNKSVEWQWQWRVHGHGRWQWYPSIEDHKYIWIEDFIKGPTDKPLKPEQTTVYVADR
jgi:hypothetical protein